MAEIKHLVRIANTDLPGEKQTMFALTGIKGVSIGLANAACALSGVSKQTKIGLLSEADVKKINDFFANPTVPSWMQNRRRDYETGEDKHLLNADLTYQIENDVKRLKMIKSNRGLRHQWGLTVRGQRTSSNHRRSKAKNAAAAKKRGKK